MRMRLAGWLVLAVLTPGAAGAGQDAGDTARSRIVVGGEISGAWSPADDRAFFNYTDYDRNNLRTARARLFGEWRMSSSVSAIAELRLEPDDNVTTPAAYVRWRPLASESLSIYVGRVPPVTGAFNRRAYGRDNAVLGQPLAYQYLTSLRPDALPTSADDVLRMRGRGWQPSFPVGASTPEPGVPLVSTTTWDTGVEVAWHGTHLETAVSVTRGSPAVPLLRDTNDHLMWAGRASVGLPRGLRVGGSLAQGEWLEESVLAILPAGQARRARQRVATVDAEAGSGPWLVRVEAVYASFDVPLASLPSSRLNLGALGAYAEARLRLHPRWYLGSRLDRLGFSTLETSNGSPAEWDAPVTRLESAVGFRATRHVDIRTGWQQNWRADGRIRRQGYPVIGASYWF